MHYHGFSSLPTRTVKEKSLVVGCMSVGCGLEPPCHPRPKNVCVRAGEMVALQCPRSIDSNTEVRLIWSRATDQDRVLTNMTADEQQQRSMSVHRGSLVILSASVEHEGKYSCTVGNGSSEFVVTVNSAASRRCEDKQNYSQTCFTQQSCKLNCPDVNVPVVHSPNITSNGIQWYKVGESLQKDNYFPTVEKQNSGLYTCVRSYQYQGQKYNMTFTVILDVQPKKAEKTAAIISPRDDDVIHVELGSTVVIDCTAVTYSEFDDVSWLIGEFTVDQDSNLPVFFNSTRKIEGDEIQTTASLVFRKISEDDLSKNYTCKLAAVYQSSDFVTIHLRNAHPQYLLLCLCTVCIVAALTAAVIVYVRFKIDIVLFLRDTLGCHAKISDDKRYDAFVMGYKSHADSGLSAEDRRWLENVLEEKFGYRLCLVERDIQPGEALANAVLDCIEESRAVVLIPSSSDPGLGSGLLTAIHEALVERQTRLIFIESEMGEGSAAGSLAEALQLLSETGKCVTWRGRGATASSSFWKHLRFYLLPSQRPRKGRFLSQTSYNQGLI
uniref:Interleukin-18 receptor 1-like n=1 Tax=Cynoglossus semilaevis TaxID=244447 RepID=A0A3P8ULD3_CYNSE